MFLEYIWVFRRIVKHSSNCSFESNTNFENSKANTGMMDYYLSLPYD